MMSRLFYDKKFSILHKPVFTSRQCLEVGPAGVHGALAAEPVELETKIVIEAVPLLFRSMEGDLAQVYRVNLSRATEDAVLVCMASVNYKRTLVLLCPKHHQSLWVCLNFNVVNNGWSSWGR